ncbi:MAG: hypothetical protein P4L83_04140, partial [Nevskia sp.]|nr:hypothetical protein [Nevskia sp.]
MKRLWVVVPALLCGCLAAPVYAGDGVLSVGRVSGSASVNRLGSVEQVSPGDLLNERDVVQVGDDGQLELEFAGHGFVEIGPGAEVGIEKLPFASYSDDLKTIFNLTHGYLRVVWKLPDVAGSWPLFVYFGDQHARLEPGEYFFDSRAGVARACVAAGRMSVLANAGTEVQKLRPPVCYRFAAGLPAQEAEHDASTWISVRRNFDIDAPTSPEALLAVGDAGAVAGEGDGAPPAPKHKATAAAEPNPAPPRAPPHTPLAP